MRGTKIAFLFYDIKIREKPKNVLYKGLVPVTYLMANNIKSNIDIVQWDYPRSISDLNTLELTSSKKLDYPFIWDKKNVTHSLYIHNIFMNLRNSSIELNL